MWWDCVMSKCSTVASFKRLDNFRQEHELLYSNHRRLSRLPHSSIIWHGKYMICVLYAQRLSSSLIRDCNVNNICMFVSCLALKDMRYYFDSVASKAMATLTLGESVDFNYLFSLLILKPILWSSLFCACVISPSNYCCMTLSVLFDHDSRWNVLQMDQFVASLS